MIYCLSPYLSKPPAFQQVIIGYSQVIRRLLSKSANNQSVGCTQESRSFCVCFYVENIFFFTECLHICNFCCTFVASFQQKTVKTLCLMKTTMCISAINTIVPCFFLVGDSLYAYIDCMCNPLWVRCVVHCNLGKQEPRDINKIPPPKKKGEKSMA